MSSFFSRIVSSWAPRPRFMSIAGACAIALALTGFGPQPATAQEEAASSDVEYAVPSDLAAESLLLDATYAGDRLVAVGEFGHVVLSDDRGVTWHQAKSVPTQSTLTGVTFVNKDLGFAVGHDATVIRTADGGETWDLVYNDSESEMAFMTVYFENEKRGFAMGAFSFIVETNDGGETWEERSLSDGLLDDYHLNKLFSDKDGDLFISAEFGVVYHSTDKGRTFNRIQTQYEGSFWGGFGMSDGSVMVFGMRGNAFRSWDKGQTWEKVETGTDKSIAGGVQLGSGKIVLVGLQGYVGYSDNGGQSFTEVTRSDRLGYAAVTDGPDGQIVVFGEPGAKVMPDDMEKAREAVGAKITAQADSES
ncbi:MAG: YCF48-related protein [Parvibaculum sp.]|uniref:WD40/YVTN/BNR-like repeat-containing protein n=1 Tax=Parvibaculum sp. TaxID=2024848 RepID=UPI002AB895E5|nr:YCF48-related protein [Parvibaculum sp.]MDZ4381171.1 YCF48-related protein [Parvibaculum sp.]